jgi:hypothetical protein
MEETALAARPATGPDGASSKIWMEFDRPTYELLQNPGGWLTTAKSGSLNVGPTDAAPGPNSSSIVSNEPLHTLFRYLQVSPHMFFK